MKCFWLLLFDFQLCKFCFLTTPPCSHLFFSILTIHNANFIAFIETYVFGEDSHHHLLYAWTCSCSFLHNSLKLQCLLKSWSFYLVRISNNHYSLETFENLSQSSCFFLQTFYQSLLLQIWLQQVNYHFFWLSFILVI